MRGRHITAVVALLIGLSVPAAAHGRALFRTPDNAAFCYLEDRSLAPENPVFGCWTPNDGFTALVAYDWTPRDIRKRYIPANKGREPRSGYPLLGFGQTFRWRCTDVTEHFAEGCSTGRGTTVLRCTSRSSGLTCRTRHDHGFWLGRFVGYRIF